MYGLAIILNLNLSFVTAGHHFRPQPCHGAPVSLLNLQPCQRFSSHACLHLSAGDLEAHDAKTHN